MMEDRTALKASLSSFFRTVERMSEDALMQELARVNTLHELDEFIMVQQDQKIIRLAHAKAFHMVQSISVEYIPLWFQKLLDYPEEIPSRFSAVVYYKAEELLSALRDADK